MEPEYGSSQEKGQLNLRKVSMLTPLTLVLLRALAAVEGVEGSVFPSCLRAIEVTLSFSPVQLSHLMASQGVALAFSGPLWASFVDNGFSRRLLLASSLLMSTVLGAIMSGASHFPTFLILRIWNGVALSTRRPVVQAVVSEEVPAKRHGWEFGVLNFSAMFGGLPAGVFFTAISNTMVLGMPGWRFSFLAVATSTLLMALLMQCSMHERPKKVQDIGFFTELHKFLSYLRIPTFQVIVLQGIVGSTPWASMAFTTLYLQYLGLSDLQCGLLMSFGSIGVALGNLLGGSIADALASWSPHHGRPLAAQISCFLGIPLAAILYLGIPADPSYISAIATVIFTLGLVDSWCAAGCNQPIFAQIVSESHRASVIAWDRCIEASLSSIIGPYSVAFLSEMVFGYKLSSMQVSEMSPEVRLANARALGHSLALCHVFPWTLCFIFYGLLHFTLKHDVQRAACSDDESPPRDDLTSEASPLLPNTLIRHPSER